MSNEVNCPLCTEAMDFTDQQFKPCKCGYQICVWCWNHLVEESEKDEVLCPACRNPYDRERIKGMTIGSDRLAEINSREKQKLRKSKSKTSELRYDPTEDRVIQRNLVYITGLHVSLANEETLRKREYFGQYGKVLKIFIKPSGPGSPHYTRSSAVYITFSKEEEAIQCIQLVNGFILNGSLLKACYGTSRYCHAWLLKKPCKNQDCSYLHHPAPEGDICAKDEVAIACTIKLQQCLGTAWLIQRRSGSSLPPPMDNYCFSTEKYLVSSSPFDTGINLRSGENEKSSAPQRAASCGLRVASERDASTAVCDGPINTSSMSNSSITSPTGMEAHVLKQGRDEYQSTEKILMPGSQSQALGELGNHESLQHCQSGYLHFLDSMGFKQLTPIADDLTRQASPNILHSATNRVNCASSAQLCPIPVRKSSVTSMQNPLLSNLQDMTLSSSPASQEVPPYFNWPSGCSDLESMKLASKSEAKGTFANSKGIDTCDTARGIVGQKVGEFSTFPDNGVGTLCQGEQEKLHTKYSGCCRQDFELKDMEHPSGHKLVKGMVQNVDPWCNNDVDLKKDIILDKIYVDSKEYRVKTDISLLNPGFAEHLANLQNLADHVDDSNRGGDCSNLSDSWLPLSSSDSRVPFANLGGAKHTSGHSFQGSADVIDPNKEYSRLHVGEKKTIGREESINRSTVGDLKNFEVPSKESTTEVVKESRHPLRLCKPASSISKPVISPPPRCPPGFPPRHTYDEGQSCSRPLISDNAQFKFSGNQSLVNSPQNIPISNSYFSVEPVDAIKMVSRGELLQSAKHLTSPVYSSNLIGADGSDRRVQFQASVGNIYENSMELDRNRTCLPQMDLHGVNTYHESQEARTVGSLLAMDSRVIGRRGQTGQTNTTNSGTSVLDHQFLPSFSERNDPEFQATEFSRLYYSQPR